MCATSSRFYIAARMEAHDPEGNQARHSAGRIRSLGRYLRSHSQSRGSHGFPPYLEPARSKTGREDSGRRLRNRTQSRANQQGGREALWIGFLARHVASRQKERAKRARGSSGLAGRTPISLSAVLGRALRLDRRAYREASVHAVATLESLATGWLAGVLGLSSRPGRSWQRSKFPTGPNRISSGRHPLHHVGLS